VQGGCSGVTKSGNLSRSPRFVSYPKRQLALRRGSPAIDKAQAAWAPGHDIVGRRRPQGPGDDIGAYERPK
ncbi:MAG: choice-of-anchor Q domain-containing protein, partial [Gaiellaceae bacterium]